MTSLLRVLLVVTVLFTARAPLHGAEITLAFKGTVLQSVPSFYGFSIPSFSMLSGEFTYDTDSPVTHTLAGGVGYKQVKPAGFQALFGDVDVWANEYIIAVLDNVPQPGGGAVDILAVRFSSDIDPTLQSPLFVENVQHAVGFFDLEFLAPPDTFGDVSLPRVIDSSIFNEDNNNFGFLSEVPLSGTPIRAIITLPEPSGVALLLLGGATILVFRSRRFRPMI